MADDLTSRRGRLEQNISLPGGAVRDFCRRHHIRKLAFFGSVLRDDFGPDSDLDILVEFEPGGVPSLFKLVDMEEELSSIFRRKVDLRTAEDLSRYFRDEVVAGAAIAYAA